MTLVRSKFIARSSSSKLTSLSISRAIAISFSSFASSFARIALLKLASSIWPNFKKIDLNLSFKIYLLSFLSSKAFFVPPFLLHVLNIKSIVSFTSSSKFFVFSLCIQTPFTANKFEARQTLSALLLRN